MKISRYWMTLSASMAVVGCTHDANQNSLEMLERTGSALEGQRVTINAYLLDQGADGLVAGFPAVAGNANPKRTSPVANGCPTEDLANLLLRFQEPMPDTGSLDGRRATVSGVYRAKETYLGQPSRNAMVYHRGFLDEVKIETVYADSCVQWTHTDD